MPNEDAAARIETLRSIPLFGDLSVSSLERILEVSGEVEVPAGQLLIQPKTEGTGLFIVEEGVVVVEKRGGEKIELGPGECFGELSLLAPHTHTARVRAKTAARCLTIDRFALRELLESEPKIAISMLEMLATRFANSLD